MIWKGRLLCDLSNEELQQAYEDVLVRRVRLAERELAARKVIGDAYEPDHVAVASVGAAVELMRAELELRGLLP